MLASTSEYDIVIASLMVSLTVAVVWIIAHYWRKTRVAAYNARLKQLMIERGMSAGEIERVLQADGNSDAGKRPHGREAIGIGCVLDTDCCARDENVKRS